MAMNDRQHEAVYATAPVVLVSAGAGSGKTRVLTARYLDLLTRKDGRVPMDRILTLTFTRKAAQEMRERIAAGLEERGLAHLRPELMRAPIGTIHGFCERVLRERALSAGIDPNFRVLDDAESQTLQENALDTIFTRFWEGTQQEREEIVRLLLDFPHHEIRAALLEVFRSARTRGLDLAELVPDEMAPLQPAADALCAAAEELLCLSGTSKWQEALQLAGKACTMLRDLLGQAKDFSWEYYDAAAELLKPLTPAGGPKDTAKAARDAIKAAMEDWLAAYLDRAAVPYLRAFGVLLFHLNAAYAELKDEQGLLDFEDLLLITRDLLRQEGGDAGEYYRTKFRQVMVDEFQDTNPLQFDLIRAFQGEGHLFMVGDVKQSIYSFIGSDVAVFLAQEERVASLGETGHRIPMGVNYRTRPEVLMPLNALFRRLWMREDGTPAGLFSFEPLGAGRQFIEKQAPSVEVAFAPAEMGDAAELRNFEGQWIARRILQLTGEDGGQALQIAREQDGVQAAANAGFGDVIILFRASSDIPRYEQALRDAGVPYYVVSGRGFYQAREVQDLMYLLAVLENPCDDFSLAVVLRSPLVGISDDTLYWLSRAWEEWTEEEPYPADTRRDPQFGRLWEAIGRVETLPVVPDAEQAALVRFRTLVTSLQEELPAGQPLDLFDRMLDETGYATGLLAMEDGEQRFANVQKLREVAAAFQARGIFDITDFKRYLSQLEELAPREPSAPLDTEGSQVVRLMTIHAAKGLESPIVFLADMGREPGRVSDTFLLASGKLACKLPVGEGEWLQSAGYRAAAETATQEDRREAERLLYVALTRAQEHLICSGSVKFKPESGRYSDILAGLLGLAEGTEKDRDLTLEYDGQTYQVRVWSSASLEETRKLPASPRPATLLEQYRPQILAGAPLPIGTGDLRHFEQVVANLQPLPPTRRDGPLRVGVNRAICYHTCPRQYWFRYVLRREEAPAPVYRDADGEIPPETTGDDERQQADGTDFGILLHGVLQLAPLNDTLLDAAPALLERVANERGIRIGEGDQQQLRVQLQGLMALPIFPRLASAGEIHRELRFLASVGGIYLPGIIDVLARDMEGWWVLDYKTGYWSPSHARQVGLYALGMKHALGITPHHVALAYLQPGITRPLRDEIVTQGMLDEAERLVTAVGAGIRRGDFPPLCGPHCAKCPFVSACPVGSSSVLVLAGKKTQE